MNLRNNTLKIVSIFLAWLLSIQTGRSQSVDSAKHEQYLDIATKIVTAALEDQRGYEMFRELCKIGPRLSGSENSMEAIQWAKNKMLSIGLDRVKLQPVMVPHWVRGDIEKVNIMDAGNELSVAALGGSISTPDDGIEAQVLEVKSFNELKKRAHEAKGKIIFFNRPMDPAKLNTFAAYGGAVDQRVHGAKEAAKYGGIAVLVRSITTKYDDFPHVGTMFYSDTIPKIPAAAVSLIGADTLSHALERNPNLKVNLKLSCQTLPDVKSYNLIGEIIGVVKPEEIILIGGHFDSWDKGHGAHDDGACCIQAIEALELFNRLHIKPKRTIRCVFFINEENGLRGAKKYARLADSTSTELHIAAIESDRGAFSPRGFTVESDANFISHLTSWLPYLRKSGIDWFREGYGGVDISQISSCPLKIGYAPDSQRYFDYHHSDNDLFSAVHPREMELGSASLAILTYLLSEEGGVQPRKESNEWHTH